MNRQLFVQAIGKYIAGLLLIGLILFIPAGTLYYRNGWIFMAVLFIPMFFVGIVMMFRSPDLLRKRLDVKETESEQKQVVRLSGLMFLTAFIIAGLNYRFQWFVLPDWVVYAATAVFLLAYLMYAEVLRENVYLSRTVEVQENQKVIDTGLYGVVRHPMYSATLLLFLSMPLILGSPISFAIMLFYIPIIGKRMSNEEKVLENGLEGYKDYRSRVKYKVLPYIW